ncbi:MAG: 1-deoxy-D-xylulose-5-phosphate synthase [Paludibacteraceae bacterium]|nr:1-deoxy-D-xylulose-5-phosphate synthase [Paludibacteraceae bacterium]
MDYRYLNIINSPKDLKNLSVEELPTLCDELRDFIIRELSHNPGHLASSLGTIELTVALHYVFDTPYDKLVWDVGHQAYAHKILTGRRDRFCTNRQFKGLAPFPTPAESEYDAFIAGHASNSISAALGIEVAHEILGGTPNVVAIIGDGAMTGGLAFEGLNNTSMDKNNLLIVLNDNNMAIDPIHGGFTQYLVNLTTSSCYNRVRWNLYQIARKLHLVNDRKTDSLRRFTNNLKTILTRQPNNIFQGLDIRYFGPADGHNVVDLVRILKEIKNHRGPKVLHIITKKGKGYAPAEENQTVWHAPGEFNVETGDRLQATPTPLLPSSPTSPLWQEVFGQTLLELAREDKRVVGVTPAMPSGCSMTIMQNEIPERVFDVGIAEGHAVTFSAGLAKEGVIPYCNIYSSFMQRAYDNIIHDVALPKLHVVFCIDRAGIVGNDGATHHGLLDLAYLRPVPNITIAAPMVAKDLKQMMRIAKDFEGPIAIRYPRGRVPSLVESGECSVESSLELKVGKGRCLREGDKVAVLSIGAIGCTVEEAITSLNSKLSNETATLHSTLYTLNSLAHWNMLWLKPIDTEILDYVGTHFDKVVTVEDGEISGGLGSAVLEYFADKGYKASVTRLGVPNMFVEHGSTKELYHMLKLDKEGLCESLLQVLEK